MKCDPVLRENRRIILTGLRRVVTDVIGITPFKSGKTNVVCFLRGIKVGGSTMWDEIDLADVFSEVEDYFGFKAERNEWTQLFGVHLTKSEQWEEQIANRLTFNDLADFVLAHVESPCIPKVVILGRSCAPAGAFRLIQRLVRRMRPQCPAFGPSSEIANVLPRTSMVQLWSQLRWRSENRLPKLRRSLSGWMNLWFVDKVILTGVIAILANFLFKHDETAYMEFFGISIQVFFVAVAISAVAWVLIRMCSPLIGRHNAGLPPEIRTFRDLANIIAQH